MRFRSFLRIKRSFSARVFLFMAGTLILLTATFTLYYLHEETAHMQEDLIKEGTILADITANNVKLGIFASDPTLIAASLQPVINVEEVVGACAYDLEGNLLQADTVSGWKPADICYRKKSLPVELKGMLESSSRVHLVDKKRTMHFWSPVISGPELFSEESFYYDIEERNDPKKNHVIGFINIAVDKTPIRKATRTILKGNFLIMLLFLGIAFVAVFYISRGLTRPIARLVENVRKRAHDKIPGVAGHDDDLGMLSATYNDMVDSLDRSFGTISELKDGLEKKVLELEAEIGRRRQTESDLRESEEKFRSISENIADGVAIILNDRIVWCNRAFCTIFGYGYSELINREVRKVIPGVVLPRGDGEDRQNSSHFMYDTVHRNNKPMLLDVKAQPVIYERQRAYQAIIRDITEEAEADMKRRELEVKALSQSKLASLGKIATSVAHEVNQPLSYIKIANEAILRDIREQRLDPDEMLEYCGESLRQVDRITFITNHLRTFGRSDTSEFLETYLPRVLANSLTLMGESLRLADIELVQDIEDDLPPVSGNSIKLEQVLINLFQNSMDALQKSLEKKIWITMRRTGDKIELLFADSGLGIPPELVESVFEPFFTTKILEERTGLGLGIVNSIIREHRGTIEYVPQKGGGAGFLIYLPVFS